MNKIIQIIKNPWVTRIYMTVLLLWVSGYFISQGGNFLRILKDSRPVMLLFSLLTYFFVVGIINPYLQSIAFREIGGNISFWQAFRIFHLSRIGNYLPGRIWFVTNYYIFSKKMNLDKEKIAKNFVVLNALLFLVGSMCSFPIITNFSPAMRILLVLFPFVMAIIIHPGVFNFIFKPLLGSSENRKDFTYSFFAKISVLYFISYIMLGIALFFSTLAFTSIDISALPQIVAAAASSLIVGMLAVFAPAGIGVSEGINAAILSIFISLEIAIMVVVALRMCMIITDFSCAFVSMVSVTREEKRQHSI